MAFHEFRTISDREMQAGLHRAHQERAAALRTVIHRIGGAISDAAGRLKAAAYRAHRRRRTYRELSALSDRALQDLGLTRQELHNVAMLAGRAVPGTSPTIRALHDADIPGQAAAVVSLAPTRRRLRSLPAPADRRPDAA